MLQTHQLYERIYRPRRLPAACPRAPSRSQSERPGGVSLIVQDDREQRVVDLEPILVVDKPQSLEFLHEEIHARSRRADHFRQRLLGDRRDGPFRLVVLAVPREQQQLSRQPFLAGVEELVDEVFLDPDVARQQVSDEPIRQRVLLVQEAHHLVLVHEKDGAAMLAVALPIRTG